MSVVYTKCTKIWSEHCLKLPYSRTHRVICRTGVCIHIQNQNSAPHYKKFTSRWYHSLSHDLAKVFQTLISITAMIAVMMLFDLYFCPSFSDSDKYNGDHIPIAMVYILYTCTIYQWYILYTCTGHVCFMLHTCMYWYVLKRQFSSRASRRF